MQMTPWDRETEFAIQTSDSGIEVDGYALNEPKRLVCEGCGASVLLTEDPSPGVDDLEHSRDCPNRFAKSDWYRGQLQAGQ